MKDAAVVWPIDNFRKSNALAIDDHTWPKLVPAGRYVLTKRISSKEERRRIVSSVYDAPEPAGLDNKLNYFHASGAGLDERVAVGLAAFLNSTVVNDYFRLFSGHTQVNATDLRNLHYPTRAQLEALGRLAPRGQDEIDRAVRPLI
jgi:adenine-specific DNA-methyltransferase